MTNSEGDSGAVTGEHRVDKPWGYERWVESNDNYTVKILMMRDGQQCSLQYHEVKRETVVVLSGTLTVLLGDREIEMQPFEEVTIPPGQVHRMMAKNGDSLYLEASTSELEDVVRLEDSYGRG
jgi:mannose-6-phosphate isomerase